MNRYKVWNPDEEGEEDAAYVWGDTPEDAAEIYLAPIVSRRHPEDYCLRVADEDNNQYEVDVDVDVYEDPDGIYPDFTSFARKVL